METTTGPDKTPRPITNIQSRQRTSSKRRNQGLVGLADRDIVSLGRMVSVLLVIEDERLLWRTAMKLSGCGYHVCAVSRVEEAPLRVRSDWAPDVLFIDLTLPTLDVASICRALRSTYAVPIVVAVNPDSQRLLGDESARNTLPRPYTADEVVRSIAGATKQSTGKDEFLVAGGLVLSLQLRQATLDGESLKLSEDEFAVLWRLVDRAGTSISRTELRDAIVGLSPDVDERIVDCYFVRLMVKLAASSSLRLVRTEYCDGYQVQIAAPTLSVVPR